MSLIDGESRQIAKSTATEAAVAREAQEVQAAMVVAKRFPRDVDAARENILRACRRRSLAESAQYEYAKGGTKITGPSIRLAEVLAQSWGNMSFGFSEIERRPGRPGHPGESVVEAHAWDLETNTQRRMSFTVQHVRDTRKGRQILTDEREIYELFANQASRRLRACILAIIPVDVQEDAVAECDKTVKESLGKEPLDKQVVGLLAAFERINVTRAMIEARIQHSVDAMTANEIVMLKKIGASIRDGFTTVAEQFSGEQKTERTLTPAIDPDGEMGGRE